MALTQSQKKYLRGLGHQLHPAVSVADAGLTDSVVAEFESTLKHHELIKVRVRVGDRDTRSKIIAKLCDSSGADLIQRVGNVALLYRENPDGKKISLPPE